MSTNLLAQVKSARRDVADMRVSLRSRQSAPKDAYLEQALYDVNRKQRQQDRQLQHVRDTILQGSARKNH